MKAIKESQKTYTARDFNEKKTSSLTHTGETVPSYWAEGGETKLLILKTAFPYKHF